MGTWLMLSALALVGQSSLVSYETPKLEMKKAEPVITYVVTVQQETKTTASEKPKDECRNCFGKGYVITEGDGPREDCPDCVSAFDSRCTCFESCGCRSGGKCDDPAECLKTIHDRSKEKQKPSNLQKAMTAALTSPQYTSHTASSPYAVRYVDNTRRQVWDGYRWTSQSLVRSCSGNACRSQWVAESYQAPSYHGHRVLSTESCGTASYYSPEGYSVGFRGGACGLLGGACGGNARAGGRQRVPLLPWRR